MDIVGEILEEIFKFVTNKSLKKIFKGEESDDIIVEDTCNKGEDGGNYWSEVKEWNEINQVNCKSEAGCSNEDGNIGAKSNLLEVYNNIKSKVSKTEDYKHIKHEAHKNTASTDIQENNKNDVLFNTSQDSNSDIKQSDSNDVSYDIQQNHNQINNELDFNKCTLRNAIIYSEILGKSKAKRRRRCKDWS